jgi:hypothetical protein
VKVFFVFALLDRGGMAEEEVAGYLARVPCYRDLSRRFLGMDDAALAQWVVEDLLRSGAVRREGARLVPTMAA